MNETQARKILDEAIDEQGGLYSLGWYIAWEPGDENATLDGSFTADDLEAIAWWMRRTEGKSEEQK